MSVHRLVYISTAAHDIDQAALDHILETSRRNNAGQDLTGFLLLLDGHFMQLLEGPRDAVMAAYERISTDTRHRDPVIALNVEGTHRCFPDWRMGCHFGTQADVMSGWTETTASGVSGVLPGTVPADVRALFLSFRGSPGVTIGVQ